LFIITEDVDDFGQSDLANIGISAVHYDLFLAERTTTFGYLAALRVISAGMKNPPRTIEDIHARLGRLHPRTVAAHATAVDAAPDAPTHNPPAVMYRGNRCLRCLTAANAVGASGVCGPCGAGST
jgi:hypothetical protein